MESRISQGTYLKLEGLGNSFQLDMEQLEIEHKAIQAQLAEKRREFDDMLVKIRGIVQAWQEKKRKARDYGTTPMV